LLVAPAIAVSNWGEVSMSSTPDTETTAVRPIHSALTTQLLGAVATPLFCRWFTIHTSLVRAQVARIGRMQVCRLNLQVLQMICVELLATRVAPEIPYARLNSG
jgi:hypothetical protein